MQKCDRSERNVIRLCSQNAYLYHVIYVCLFSLISASSVMNQATRLAINACVCALPEQVDCEENEDDEKERDDQGRG